MTNQFRLKILGLGLVLVGLGSIVLSFNFIPPGTLGGWMVLGGWLLPIIGLGCYARAKQRSVFWAAMGIVLIVGPILALVVIGIDEVLAKRAAPRWIHRVVTVGVALFVLALFLAIVIPNFLRFSARSPHSTAKIQLLSIYVAETAFKAELGRYGTFAEVGFDIDPSYSSRYTYRIDNSGKPGTVFPAKDGTLTPDNTVVHAGVSADGQSFTATATANLDDDPTLDQWHINDIKKGRERPDVNDITD